jgi:hypothetical protein
MRGGTATPTPLEDRGLRPLEPPTLQPQATNNQKPRCVTIDVPQLRKRCRHLTAVTDGRLGRGDQGPGLGGAQSAAAVVVPVDLPRLKTRPSAAGSLPRPPPQELRPRLRAKPHVPVLPHARGRGAQVAARAQDHGRVQGRGRKLGHLGSLADHDSPGALEQAGQVLGAEALLLGVDRLTDGRLGRGDQGPGPGAAQSAAAVVVPVDLHPPKIAAQAPRVQASPAPSPAPDRDLTRRENPRPRGRR